MKFNELTLIPPLLRAVSDAGYKEPSPIQQKAIPPVLAGRDLLGCAQTGTGKTAAFALPILQLLAAKTPAGKKAIRSLILTPTRELALQIEENFELYGKYLPLRSAVIFGGVGQNPQVAQLKRGIDVLVATPGRLNDLIGQGYIDLSFVEIFVLDEADRMLDMGFVHDVKKVIAKLPEKRQTLLFSATMPAEIVQLANSLLHKPTKVFVTPQATTVELINQTVYKVDKGNKKNLLAQLLRASDVQSALVFTRTKHGADRVVRELSRAGIKAMAIHGNKSQNARQDALAKFKDGRVKVLVATDIAARGIDINELTHVFNYDLPNIPETYVHRIGRTGRAGHGGVAVSFANVDELEYLADIEKLIGMKVPEVTDHDWPMEIFEKTDKKQQANNRGRTAPAPQRGKAPAGGKQAKAQKPATKPAQKPAQAAKSAPLPAAKPAADAKRESPARPPQKPARAAAPQNTQKQPARGNRQNGRGKPRSAPPDPYDNLSGPKAIVTKKPIWGDSFPQEAGAPPEKGDDTMARNNRRRGGKNRQNQNGPAGPQKQQGKGSPLRPKKAAPPPIPKGEHGVFDFSEDELSEDQGIRVISRSQPETKYASFDDFLKDH